MLGGGGASLDDAVSFFSRGWDVGGISKEWGPYRGPFANAYVHAVGA